MTITPSTDYWEHQLSLFGGGYRHIQLDLCLHLTGSGDTVPVGAVAKDHQTGELVAMQIPAFTINLRQPASGLAVLHEFIMHLQEQLDPF